MVSSDAKKIRVLMVDDDEDDFILTRCLFEEFRDNRYALEWTASASEALSHMAQREYDVYLVDFRLGAENGLDLVRAGIAGGCQAPMILLTGQSEKEVDLEAMEAGAADYLVKGRFDAQLLERTIRYSIQQARSLRRVQSSEMKFRSVVQSASDAIFLVNGEGRVSLWNDAAMQIFGYTEADMERNSVTVLMGEEHARMAADLGVREMIENVLAPNSGKAIYASGRRKDGSEFPLEMSGSVWRSDGEVYYTAIIRDITERLKASATLKESEERYRDLFENANDAIYVHDLAGNFVTVNQTGEKAFGFTREEATSLNMSQVVAPEYLELANKHIAAKIAGEPASSYEIECLGKDGQRIAVEINSRVILDKGVPVAIQGIARNVTDRRRAEEERDRLYNVSNDLLATISFEGTLLHINPAWEKNLGYGGKELIGRSIDEITHLDDCQQNAANIENFRNGVCVSFESRLICKDGSVLWISWNSTPMVAEGIFYAVGRNITEKKHAEEILEFNALYDKLTNLPNRTHFMNHLEEAIAEQRRKGSKKFAVLFLDLDRFKIINDGLGHLIGDKLLIAISERIKSTLRPGDIVARLGGDEFTLLIHNVNDVSDATMVAERIQNQLANPFRLDNYEVYSSASIGIIVADDTLRKPEDFLRDADAAMYRAKDRGKARYEIFDDEMFIRNMNLLQVETDLRRALERDEFRVYYQPVVELETGAIKEVEALVRWQHGEYGLVAPDEFINIAEETGLIIPIGEWVLGEACRQVGEWQKSAPHLANLAVSVNLSAKQLMHPSLVGQVTKWLTKTQLEANHLKLEVTESTVMENPETALEILNKLCRIGIGFSTDDFGTGYSSLSYLHRFPFSRIKIDRGFIGKMQCDAKSKAIVQTILMLGQNLGIEVVAEGIENIDQLRLLRSMGCRAGQGYLFSKPLSAEFARDILLNGLKSDAVTSDYFCKISEPNVIEIASSQ
ncbi:MAG: EAL domain-containing protein [Acidobacteria bacterium]|nr:EAL domain-containing protein [Acidobacteriota bacterium]